MLKFTQWNARSISSNKESLVKFLADNSIDIAMISETWRKLVSVLRYPDITLYVKIDSMEKPAYSYLLRKVYHIYRIS